MPIPLQGIDLIYVSALLPISAGTSWVLCQTVRCEIDGSARCIRAERTFGSRAFASPRTGSQAVPRTLTCLTRLTCSIYLDMCTWVMECSGERERSCTRMQLDENVDEGGRSWTSTQMKQGARRPRGSTRMKEGRTKEGARRPRRKHEDEGARRRGSTWTRGEV